MSKFVFVAAIVLAACSKAAPEQPEVTAVPADMVAEMPVDATPVDAASDVSAAADASAVDAPAAVTAD